MITSISIHSGFAADLPCLKKREFIFQPGINMVFGKNGSGKTSLLKIIAGYCCIQNEGGWSKRPIHIEQKSQFPAALVDGVIGNCVADVAWDGSPTFLNQSAYSDTQMPGYFETNNPADSIDGISIMTDQLSTITGKLSTGQVRLMKIMRIVETLKTPPATWSLARRCADMSVRTDAFLKYIRSLPRKGPSTVLLDEPDKGLDLRYQALLWQNTIPKIAKHFQVIATTHSLLAFLKYNQFSKHGLHCSANFVDLDEKYTIDAMVEMSVLSADPVDFMKVMARIVTEPKKDYMQDYRI